MEDTHFIDKEPNRYEALAELQKEQIQSMNEDQIIEIVRKFEIFWDLQTEDYRNARELDIDSTSTKIIGMRTIILSLSESISWQSREFEKNNDVS